MVWLGDWLPGSGGLQHLPACLPACLLCFGSCQNIRSVSSELYEGSVVVGNKV